MKVMLAEKTSIEEVKFPVLASPKLDGVRCFIEAIKGTVQASSRTGKPIPNKYIQSILGGEKGIPLINLDGELTCGEANTPDVFRKTTSAVMTRVGRPNFIYNVFDWAERMNSPFSERYEDLEMLVKEIGDKRIKLVEHTLIEDIDHLYEFEKKCLLDGYEGVMVRSLDGKYKEGRSTKRQGWLLKIKRFCDAEAIIVGIDELMKNENEAYLNEIGYTHRSSSQENLKPAGTLGSLIVKCVDPEICSEEFSIGTGFDAALRQMIWDHKESYFGNIVTFKYFPSGSKDKPRFPVFKGFRDKRDM